MRSKVDLPEPDRPSRPRISPSRNITSISASTGSGSPEGLAKPIQTLRSSMTGGAMPAITPEPSIEPRPTFGKDIERAP